MHRMRAPQKGRLAATFLQEVYAPHTMVVWQLPLIAVVNFNNHSLACLRLCLDRYKT